LSCRRAFGGFWKDRRVRHLVSPLIVGSELFGGLLSWVDFSLGLEFIAREEV
jgi:hypothetical protein